MQLLLQATWDTDDAGLLLVQQRAFTLIAMFDECSSSVLPIACPSDFTTGTQGWSAFSGTGCPGTVYAIYVPGEGWQPGCQNCCGVSYWQLQILKSFSPSIFVNSVTIRYTSTAPIFWSLVDDGSGITAPPGTDLTSTDTVNRTESTVRVIALTNDSSNFTISEVIIEMTVPSGVCP